MKFKKGDRIVLNSFHDSTAEEWFYEKGKLGIGSVFIVVDPRNESNELQAYPEHQTNRLLTMYDDQFVLESVYHKTVMNFFPESLFEIE